jgi:hypothetical protein
MAATVEVICNLALSKLGAEPITAIGDNTRRAKLCNTNYDALRKKVMRSYPWNFATKRVALVLNSSVVGFEYANLFDLPADLLRAMGPDNPKDREYVDWKVESGFLLTNEEAFTLKYIADVTDPTLFDPSFDQLLALSLAKDLAYPLVQSNTLKEALEIELRSEEANTRSFDSQEGNPDEVETNLWLNSRL